MVLIELVYSTRARRKNSTQFELEFPYILAPPSIVYDKPYLTLVERQDKTFFVKVNKIYQQA